MKTINLLETSIFCIWVVCDSFKRILLRFRFVFFLCFLFFSLQHCYTIAPFSQVAYQQAIDLKVDSLKLIAHAQDAYFEHESQVNILQTQLDKAVEYAKGRPRNEISTRQWQIMVDPKRYLLGGFLSRWKQEKTVSETFIKESSSQISQGFDAIIGLESGKIKPQDVAP